MCEVWMYSILPCIWESMKAFGTLNLSADSALGYINFFFLQIQFNVRECFNLEWVMLIFTTSLTYKFLPQMNIVIS